MARDLTSAMVAECQLAFNRPAIFLQLEFVGGTARFWTGQTVKSWNGYDWAGTGDLAAIADIEGSTDGSPRQVSFALSGVPSTTLSATLTDRYQGRPCYSWFAFLDGSGAVLSDPYEWFAGRMSVLAIDEEASSPRVTVTCESHLADFRRPRATRYTPAQQEYKYPGDTGMRFVAGLAEAVLYWGIPTPSGATGTPPVTSIGTPWLR